MCCIRIPGETGSGRRLQEVRPYSTMTRSLLVMADRLAELGVTRVVMEATSDYWRGVFYLLEAHGFQTWLAGARDVKHLPGRPKTDTLDAVWLCKGAQRQMLRAKLGPLEEAFTGLVTDQHAFLLRKMLARVDALDADLAELDAKIQQLIDPLARAVERLDEIPGSARSPRTCFSPRSGRT